METVEVVIDPDAAGEEGALVEDGQLIAVERSGLSDEASEQVTRWAAALEGYRKEQVRLGIPYGETQEGSVWTWQTSMMLVYEARLCPSRSCPLVSRPSDPLGRVGDERVQYRRDGNRQHSHPRARPLCVQPRRVPPESAQWRDTVESPGAATQM